MLGDDKEVYRKDLPKELFDKMEGTVPPDEYASNGCSVSPDYVGPHNLQPACHFHDYAYGLWEAEGRGGTEQARMQADNAMYRNLRKCGLPRRLAWLYFAGVHLRGHRSYKYKPGDEPRYGVMFYVRLITALFLRW